MQKKKKGAIAWLKELSVMLLLAVVVSITIDMYRSQSMISGTAPSLVSQSIQGELIDIAKMSENGPVLVYFWGTWCPICSSVSPSVDFMAGHYSVVSVALTSGEPKRVQQYLKSKDYGFATINDPKGLISKEWSVSVTPTIFIVNKGEVTSVTTGFTSPIGMWIRLLFF